MAKKVREALFFVRKTTGKQETLFAVTGMPERTTAPKETGHYILFNGNKNKRHKMKINSVKYATHVNGNITVEDRTKIAEAVPNFEKVEGKLLEEMYSKCCPAFKRTFPL